MINGKVIYTPKGAALEYGRVGANFYTGCPHNCEYCYLKRGIIGKALGGTEVNLKKTLKDPDTAFVIFEREVARHIDECRKHGIFFSFTCDPLIMETRCLTLRAIYHCVENGIPVWLLTKDATFSYDPDWMSAVCEEFTPEQKAMTHFGFTLTGRDDMEPGASTNDGRILAMSRVKQAGFKTWASIEPVIDWDSADKVVIGSLDYCDHYKIGLRSGVKRDYYNPQESTERIFRLVYTITSNDRTVYLKESVRRMLRETCSDEVYQALLRETVSMDLNPEIKNSQQR